MHAPRFIAKRFWTANGQRKTSYDRFAGKDDGQSIR